MPMSFCGSSPASNAAASIRLPPPLSKAPTNAALRSPRRPTSGRKPVRALSALLVASVWRSAMSCCFPVSASIPRSCRQKRMRCGKMEGVMLIAVGDQAAGLVAVADPIKQSAVAALQALRADGIRVVMLTGDSRVTAMAVGRKLGIDEVVAEVLPDQKAA